MDNQEFSRIRRYLGKTQREMGRLLCVSPKAIQSYEQGWRHVPADIERQVLLLLSLKQPNRDTHPPCWETNECPEQWRKNCIVWEYRVKNYCWLVNGTFCQGRFQSSWSEKLKVCRQCDAGLFL